MKDSIGDSNTSRQEPWIAMEAMLNDAAAAMDDSVLMVGPSTSPDDDCCDNLLNLCMLSCETKPPYGPSRHTAQLLADLLQQAAQQCKYRCNIRIQIFEAQKEEYPDDFGRFDGILLPGSFSSAYDDEPWIEQLKRVIQDKIVATETPTLAICFGHQILAHSFDTGTCVKSPLGPRAGRYSIDLTEPGQKLLNMPKIQLYYTHNDMVSELPDSAVSLGGSDGLPVLAAAYYGRQASSNNNNKPYAVSFQAHPEYATSLDLGVYRTLYLCCSAMEQVHAGALDDHWKDCADNLAAVQRDSVQATVAVARLLGWFPDDSDSQ